MLGQVFIALFYFLIAHVLEYKCMLIHVIIWLIFDFPISKFHEHRKQLSILQYPQHLDALTDPEYVLNTYNLNECKCLKLEHLIGLLATIQCRVHHTNFLFQAT